MNDIPNKCREKKLTIIASHQFESLVDEYINLNKRKKEEEESYESYMVVSNECKYWFEFASPLA